MSIRNNEDRLGAKQPDESPPTPQMQAPHASQSKSSATFSFVVPSEFVELPSKGKFYPQSHPLHNKEVVEIKHMTAKEEDLLTSRSLLKKGLAINRVLQSVLVDKSIDVESLLVGDKNAILIDTRIHAYGSEYQTSTTCPACSETSQHSFDLSELQTKGSDLSEGDVTRRGNNFIFVLPRTKVKVEVRLLNGKDEKFLADSIKMKRKNNLPDAALTDQFRMFIVSVNGHSDPKSISEFVNGVPASDSRYLRTIYERIVPNVDMKQNFTCNSCDYDAAMEVPLSADFFWPKQ
jgi:hypothetical protein